MFRGSDEPEFLGNKFFLTDVATSWRKSFFPVNSITNHEVPTVLTKQFFLFSLRRAARTLFTFLQMNASALDIFMRRRIEKLLSMSMFTRLRAWQSTRQHESTSSASRLSRLGLVTRLSDIMTAEGLTERHPTGMVMLSTRASPTHTNISGFACLFVA